MGQQTAPEQELEMWDEEQLEQALRHLKLLHIKCRELRSTVPRMLEPLTKQATAEDVYRSFKGSAHGAVAEIKAFEGLYQSEESRKIMGQANRSREAEPKGIKPWRARDHPDWLELDDNGV